ncbi:hypothetical protein C8J57DRAFT_1715771 [Mycena rebaudengoi]|nr:hypothetical protein C8J57DRAFT_1715771 [Mycena rebaudengoi]
MPPRANRSATPTTTTTGTTPPTGTPFTAATTSSKRRTQALRIHRPPLPDPELEETGVDEPRMEEQERASPSKYPTPLPDEGSLTPVEETEAAPPTPEEEGELGRIAGGEIEAAVGGIEVEARADKEEAVVDKQEEAVAGTKGNGPRRRREENTAHLRAPEAPRPRPPSTALSATSAAKATVSAVSAAAAPLARSALSPTLRALGDEVAGRRFLTLTYAHGRGQQVWDATRLGGVREVVNINLRDDTTSDRSRRRLGVDSTNREGGADARPRLRQRRDLSCVGGMHARRGGPRAAADNDEDAILAARWDEVGRYVAFLLSAEGF